jgi:hypothetical protein
LPTSVDHIFQDLIYGVLVLTCPPCHLAPNFFAIPSQKRRRRHIPFELLGVGEQPSQVTIVEIGVF